MTVMVIVTGVDVSKDFKFAKVHVTVLGDENDVKVNLEALNSAAHFIRVRLNERISLKHINVKFCYVFLSLRIHN